MEFRFFPGEPGLGVANKTLTWCGGGITMIHDMAVAVVADLGR